jgi:hypothetical protein
MSATADGNDQGLIDGLLVSGGRIREIIGPTPTVLSEHLGQILQTRNLVVLLGAGASFHVGSPKIRNVSKTDLETLTSHYRIELKAEAWDLLDAIIENEYFNLEDVASRLQASIAALTQIKHAQLQIGQEKTPVEIYYSLRDAINKTLALSCDLPIPGQVLSKDPFDANLTRAAQELTSTTRDPLWAHRLFLSRIVRSRRPNLPRPRIFTTNYDLLVEKALDEMRLPYIDGFAGTVNRELDLSTYSLDFHAIDHISQNHIKRLDSALYVHKVHGSVNWYAEESSEDPRGLRVRQRNGEAATTNGDRPVLIYPTPAKESDSLAYPYSDLLRMLSAACQLEDTAVLTVGYSFLDEHLNRMLLNPFATNTSLYLLACDPYAVFEDYSSLSSSNLSRGTQIDSSPGLNYRKHPLARLAAAADERIAVLTGPAAKFSYLAAALPDPLAGNTRELNESLIKLLTSVAHSEGSTSE